MVVLLTCKQNYKSINKMISSAFLGHQVRGGTPLGSLAISSGSLAALVGIQAVVGRGEVVLTQDDLLESLRHTVGRGQNMPGGDEDPGTTPGNVATMTNLTVPRALNLPDWIRILEERHPGPVPGRGLLPPRYPKAER